MYRPLSLLCPAIKIAPGPLHTVLHYAIDANTSQPYRPPMLNGQTHNEPHTTDTQPPEGRHHSVGLTQAYEFRDFAFAIAKAVMSAKGEALDAEASRARALRDANTVWQTSQDESRVCRGVGKPKGVTAKNDPARQSKSKPHKPAVPVPLDP